MPATDAKVPSGPGSPVKALATLDIESTLSNAALPKVPTDLAVSTDAPPNATSPLLKIPSLSGPPPPPFELIPPAICRKRSD